MRAAQASQADGAILVARYIVQREHSRVVDRSHLKVDLPAPAAAVSHQLTADQRGIDDIDLDAERHLTAEVRWAQTPDP